MIISFERNFIFVKTRKTAGTSLEMALTPFCGPRDILTPIAHEDEVARQVDGVVQARNYAGGGPIEAEFKAAIMAGDMAVTRRFSVRLQNEGHFFNHMPLAVARKRLDPAFFQQAFKFTVERHPYERVVSGAHYRAWMARERGEQPDRFSDYVDRIIASPDLNARGLYCLDGKVAVDLIIRQEQFDADMRALFDRLGLPAPATFPRAKAVVRPDRRPADEVLTAAQKQAIFAKTAKVFQELGYRR